MKSWVNAKGAEEKIKLNWDLISLKYLSDPEQMKQSSIDAEDGNFYCGDSNIIIQLEVDRR